MAVVTIYFHIWLPRTYKKLNVWVGTKKLGMQELIAAPSYAK